MNPSKIKFTPSTLNPDQYNYKIDQPDDNFLDNYIEAAFGEKDIKEEKNSEVDPFDVGKIDISDCTKTYGYDVRKSLNIDPIVERILKNMDPCFIEKVVAYVLGNERAQYWSGPDLKGLLNSLFAPEKVAQIILKNIDMDAIEKNGSVGQLKQIINFTEIREPLEKKILDCESEDISFKNKICNKLWKALYFSRGVFSDEVNYWVEDQLDLINRRKNDCKQLLPDLCRSIDDLHQRASNALDIRSLGASKNEIKKASTSVDSGAQLKFTSASLIKYFTNEVNWHN